MAALLAGACSGSDGAERARPLIGESGQRASVDVDPVVATSPTFTTTTVVAAMFEFVLLRVESVPDGAADLRVFHDGRVRFDAEGETVEFDVAGPAGVETLVSALESAHVETLEPSYGPDDAEVRYNLLYGSRSVRFSEGSVPQGLEAALRLLTVELDRGREQAG